MYMHVYKHEYTGIQANIIDHNFVLKIFIIIFLAQYYWKSSILKLVFRHTAGLLDLQSH